MSAPRDEKTARVLELARAVGFDDAGVAPVALPHERPGLEAWLDAGYAGSMRWLERDRDVRVDLRERFPWAMSVVVVLRGYRPAPADASSGLSRFVSSYARGADYHDILLPRLTELSARIRADLDQPDLRSHAYVDTGPTLERALASAAGLGWQAKNTLLLSEEHGSRFFLGLLVTELDLAPTSRDVASCGTCRACQAACPTDAFAEPGVLDARRCISYLTIEHRGSIDVELRPGMGQWLFGCDLCQTCCPFEIKRQEEGDLALRADGSLGELSLGQLLALDEVDFRGRFRATPLWRSRREGLLRNALIVVANGEHEDCRGEVSRLCDDPSETLRETAAWCLQQLDTVRSRTP